MVQGPAWALVLDLCSSEQQGLGNAIGKNVNTPQYYIQLTIFFYSGVSFISIRSLL
jgi:hypothetical protein